MNTLKIEQGMQFEITEIEDNKFIRIRFLTKKLGQKEPSAQDLINELV